MCKSADLEGTGAGAPSKSARAVVFGKAITSRSDPPRTAWRCDRTRTRCAVRRRARPQSLEEKAEACLRGGVVDAEQPERAVATPIVDADAAATELGAVEDLSYASARTFGAISRSGMSSGFGAVNGWCTAASAPVVGSRSNIGEVSDPQKADSLSDTMFNRRATSDGRDRARRSRRSDGGEQGQLAVLHAEPASCLERRFAAGPRMRLRGPSRAASAPFLASASISSTCFRDRAAPPRCGAPDAAALLGGAGDAKIRSAKHLARVDDLEVVSRVGVDRSAPSRPRTSDARSVQAL
jgi:hypothetical protein